jgi:hypothetical protein
MKKLFAITLLLLTGLTASAQGTWSTGMNEADELKGEKGGPYYCYDLEGMGILFYGTGKTGHLRFSQKKERLMCGMTRIKYGITFFSRWRYIQMKANLLRSLMTRWKPTI